MPCPQLRADNLLNYDLARAKKENRQSAPPQSFLLNVIKVMADS